MKKNNILLIFILLISGSVISLLKINEWMTDQKRIEFIYDNSTVITSVNKVLPDFKFVQLEQVQHVLDVPTWWRNIVLNWTKQENLYMRFFIARKYDPKLVSEEQNQVYIGIVTEYGNVYHLNKNTYPE